MVHFDSCVVTFWHQCETLVSKNQKRHWLPVIDILEESQPKPLKGPESHGKPTNSDFVQMGQTPPNWDWSVSLRDKIGLHVLRNKKYNNTIACIK